MYRSFVILAAATLLAAANLTAVRAEPKTDWPTFGFDTKRSGYNPSETRLGPDTAAGLRQLWVFDAAAFAQTAKPRPDTATGAFFAQPVVAADVDVAGARTDLVLVGDNDGLFFALDANSPDPKGTVLWTRTLPLVMQVGCPAQGPAGILSTAVVDRAANGRHGAVYVAANTKVYGFDLASGRTIAGWPAEGLTIPQLKLARDGFIRSGLMLANGALYVENASKCDDPPFHGQIARIDTQTATVTAQWFSMSGDANVPARSGGSIWGPGGVSIDTSELHPSIYTATGNAMPPRDPAEVLPLAEAVVRLSPDLSTLVNYHQVGFIAPDDDLGSTPVLFEADGCPNKLLAVQQKSGIAYVYQRLLLGRVAPQAIKLSNTLSAFHGNAAWDPRAQVLLFANPADGPAPFGRGLVALKQTRPCEFHFAWQSGNDLSGNPMIANDTVLSSPAVANGVAYFGVARQRTIKSIPRLFAVADDTRGGVHAGQVLWQSEPYKDGIVAAPVVVNGRVFVATFDGHIYSYGRAGK